MHDRIDFKALVAELHRRIEQLVPEWLPGGSQKGKEYTCADIRGGKGRSFSICMSGDNQGRWSDFAGDIKGGDLLSLYCAIYGLKPLDGAKELRDKLGIRESTARTAPPPKQEKNERKIGLPPVDAPGPQFHRSDWGDPATIHPYRLADGRLQGYVTIYRPPGERKQPLPWSWCDTEQRWRNWAFPDPRPLYGLDLLAARPDAPAIIVEGEPCADALRPLATMYVVVAWPGGSQALTKADLSPLKGRKLLLWPDADTPGINCMRRVAEQMHGQCPEVKYLDITGMPEGWDCKDAIEIDGWDWAKIVEWAKPRARVYEPPRPPPEANPLAEVARSQPEAPKPPTPDDRQPTVKETASATAESPTVASCWQIWQDLGLACTDKGIPYPNVDNVQRVLEKWEPMRGVIWFDEFRNQLMTSRTGPAREWADHDDVWLQTWFQRDMGMVKMSKDCIQGAIVGHARKFSRNEPKDWMESLTWDGTPRLEHFLEDHLGADATAYVRAVSKNWWISLVARIYRPGCKVDTMMVLEGPQGIRKSSALAAIGGAWYAEIAERVDNKDFHQCLQGKMLVEIAELDAFGKSEVTRIKQVITCATDRYRASYGRYAEDHPRKCVFVGSTNDDHYLRDATGGRRFWPVRCRSIDLDGIKANRDQLFAEAVALLKQGASWWEMPADETEREQEARRQVDSWEEPISAWLRGRESEITAAGGLSLTTTEILRGALGMDDVSKHGRGEQTRVGGIMKVLGWKSDVVWQAGSKRSVRMWRRA